MHVDAWSHVSLSVRDLDASVAWYTSVLGFEVAFREPVRDGRAAAVLAFPGGPLALGLTQHGPGGSPFDPAVTGLDHAAFRVATAEALDAWVAWLDDHGVTHSGISEAPNGRFLNLKDPDGIALALVWLPPV